MERVNLNMKNKKIKIFASDYDGTLRINHQDVTQRNLDAIKEWRKAGNKFGICTGRGPHMIRPEITRQNMEIDYVVCANGAVILDKDLQVEKAYTMQVEDIINILNTPEAKKCIKAMIATTDNNYEYVINEDLVNMSKSPFSEDISYEGLKDITNIVQVTLVTSDKEQTVEIRNSLINTCSDKYRISSNNFCTDITVLGRSKTEGILDMQRINGWEDGEIYVAGDDFNDIDMLKYFNGFTVETASNEIKALSSKVYEDVAEMLYSNM